ncbi:MAG: DoxX family protein [Chloroflexi bacterium]|nr:DoxX family protein [Chloroflexota bacterium]
MAEMKVETHDKKGWRDKFLQRDLPVAYLLVRATMGFHMIAHGGVRLPILDQFAAETVKTYASVNLLGLYLFPGWLVTIICYAIPPVQVVIGILLTVGFKTRLASIAGSILMLVLMFGMVAQKNFGTAHLMWFYVLIFAVLGALNFADRYSLDAILKRPPKD